MVLVHSAAARQRLSISIRVRSYSRQERQVYVTTQWMMEEEWKYDLGSPRKIAPMYDFGEYPF